MVEALEEEPGRQADRGGDIGGASRWRARVKLEAWRAKAEMRAHASEAEAGTKTMVEMERLRPQLEPKGRKS